MTNAFFILSTPFFLEESLAWAQGGRDRCGPCQTEPGIALGWQGSWSERLGRGLGEAGEQLSAACERGRRQDEVLPKCRAQGVGWGTHSLGEAAPAR